MYMFKKHIRFKTIAQNRLHGKKFIPIISQNIKIEIIPKIHEMPLDRDVAFAIGMFLAQEN